MAMSKKPKNPAPKRCAKPDCDERQPCPIEGHETKQWANTAYYTPITAADRAEVIRQAGGRCRKCGRPANPGQVDHVVNVARGGRNEMSNYQLLCVPCHTTKTQAEAKEGRRRARGR
jgi:5-methylcytosine-specific restriction protein A